MPRLQVLPRSTLPSVAAVPGAGKTSVLSWLANRRVDPALVEELARRVGEEGREVSERVQDDLLGLVPLVRLVGAPAPPGRVEVAGQGGDDGVDVAVVEVRRRAPAPDLDRAKAFYTAALQPLVAENLVNQILEGNRSIVGMMLESNLHWGNQPIPSDRSELRYGVSVTDACVDWETTEGLPQSLDARLRSAPRFANGPAAA